MLLRLTLVLVLLASAVVLLASGPEYRGAELKFPAQYRDWVFLSSGFDMSYGPNAAKPGHSVFDNVFVNPEAYAAFRQSGTWPDGTVLVLEIRTAEGKGSINRSGHFQGAVSSVEVHVKDASRFPGKWAFFGFPKQENAKLIPASAGCYSCHAEHGAVDTTFVQFYPTLLPVARSKATLSEAYRKETRP